MIVARPDCIARTVVIVNGIAGCGKTLLSSIVSSLERLELEKYDYPLEWVCQVRHLNRIEDDAAHALIRIHCDLDLYNLMMSRETNFRTSDLSGVMHNPRPWRYVRRLFQPGDAAVMDRIDREDPVLNLVTHNLLSIGRPVFSALGERLRFIEVVRHPLYMLKQWRLFMPRYGTDPRHFSPWIQVDGRNLPWFALGWEDLFLRSNMMDRAILSIDRLLRMSDAFQATLTKDEKDRLLIIPFEPFVLRPEPSMKALTSLIGTDAGKTTRREMRRQKVPRRMVAEGIDLKIYRENGWKPPEEGDESSELKLRWDFAAAEATPEALSVLERLCREYESRHLREIPSFSLKT